MLSLKPLAEHFASEKFYLRAKATKPMEKLKVHKIISSGASILLALVQTVHADLPAKKDSAPKPAAKSRPPLAAPASPAAPVLLEPDSFWERAYSLAIKEKLSLGLRVSDFSLTDSHRPEDTTRRKTFIGYVNELKAEDVIHIQPTAYYKFNRYLSLEFTMDEVSARTENFNNHLTDGVVTMSGPIFNIFASCPFWDARVNPYIGIGYAPWKSKFSHDEWWMLGWGSPRDYEKAGSPGVANGGYERRIYVEDDSGIVWTAGVNAKLHRAAELDFMVRWLDLAPKNEHGTLLNGVYSKQREGAFSLNHVAIGCALRVVF